MLDPLPLNGSFDGDGAGDVGVYGGGGGGWVKINKSDSLYLSA